MIEAILAALAGWFARGWYDNYRYSIIMSEISWTKIDKAIEETKSEDTKDA